MLIRSRGLTLLWVALLAWGCTPPKQPDEGAVAAQAADEEALEQCSVGEPALDEQAAKPSPKKVEPRTEKLTRRNDEHVPSVKVAPQAKPEQPKLPPGDGPQIAADEMVFDYGKVSQGDKVKHTFVVKNTGKLPLAIERADGG